MRSAKPSAGNDARDQNAWTGDAGPTGGTVSPALSGKAWTTRFPTSRRIEDLASPFRERVAAFIAALERAGARVKISATLRPRERAYLMHWAWRISEEGFAPEEVPAMAGVDIDWRHPTAELSRRAARAMVGTYSLVRVADLESRHCEGRAIDMTIEWRGKLKVADPDGRVHLIAGRPRDGTHPDLTEVGRRYGVIKLAADPPHWSDDGR